jgi:transcriptional regulator with XRE-family HTH domain
MPDESEGVSFAGYLQTLRKRRRYSRSELARRADIDATYLGRIERDLLPPPRPKNLFRLAAALGLDEEERTRLLTLSGRADSTPLPLPEIVPAAPTVQPAAAIQGHSIGDSVGLHLHALRDDEQVAAILRGMAGLEQQVARLLAEREGQVAASVASGLREEEVLASVEAILSPRVPLSPESPPDVSGGGPAFRTRGEGRGELRELHGQEAVLNTMIEMISSVPPPSRPHGHEILLATHWIDDMFDAVPYLCEELWTALERALRRGWDIVHLMALNGHDGQSTAWIRAMIGLLGAPGQYLPHYFAREAPAPLPYSFTLVPDVGAMQLIAELGKRQVRSALLYPEYPAASSALGELFVELRQQASPLLHTHRERSASESPSPSLPIEADLEQEARYVALSAAFLAAEERENIRLTIWPNFPSATIPTDVLQRQLCRWYGTAEVSGLPAPIRKALAIHRRGHGLLHQRTRSRRYRSICDRQVIERYLRDGEYGVDHPLLKSATHDERVDHLQSLLSLLRDTRFELALADTPPEHLFDTGLSVMPTAQGGSVFLVGWKLLGGGHDRVIDGEITEPGVVNGFRLYFDNAWSQLPSHCTDKAQVIVWLEDQLERLLST